ncbi:MAG: hypothetical protein FJ286_17510, partial [Planctomycetes bacterium]|nr:hypothetical protein [Planctomycetota bacterium]
MLMQLLVEQRDTLEVGDLVPVGDLFDLIADGAQGFSPEMARHFENAARLYNQKLLPALEAKHGRLEQLQTLPFRDPKRTAFRNDDRLLKTLLLAALVPGEKTLKGLTASRLAALNHGTIRSPIPGQEAQEVLRRCREWAGTIGEIRIGGEQDPAIAIQLSAVDTDSILAEARAADTFGERVRRVRRIVYDRAGVDGEDLLEQTLSMNWKGTPRQASILFKNIRELPDSSLENAGEDWRLILDYPFDEPGHSPREDLDKLTTFQSTHRDGARTICWVPSFLGSKAVEELGLLVRCEHVLGLNLPNATAAARDERFRECTRQLNEQDRQSARIILENQQAQLEARVRTHVAAAYGLSEEHAGSLAAAQTIAPADQFVSLKSQLGLSRPAAVTFSDALSGLLSQALAFEYPAAPDFGAEVKISNVKKVGEKVLEALDEPGRRVHVEPALRPLVRGIANPLRLGSPVTIQFRSAGLAGTAAVDVAVSLDNGISWTTVATAVPLDSAGRGQATWTPTTTTSGNTALIRVQSGSVSDISDAAFLVANAGTDFYVNDGSPVGDGFTTAVGNNLNSGKSPSQPMKSLRGLLAAYDLNPGDVIHVDAGAYRLVRNIVLTDDDSGVVVEGFVDAVDGSRKSVLNRGNTADRTAVFQFAGADDVTIRGLGITGAQRGIVLDLYSPVDSDRVTITGNEIFGNYYEGIYSSSGWGASDSEFLLISDNDIWGNERGINGGIPSGQSGFRMTITGNRVRSNSQVGIAADGSGVLVTNNTVWSHVTGSYGGSGISVSGGAVARGNIAFANGTGIRSRDGGLVDANRVYNNGRGIYGWRATVTGNTVYSNSTGIQIGGDWGDTYYSQDNALVANNLVYANTNVGINVSSSFPWGGDPSSRTVFITNNTVYQSVGNAVSASGSRPGPQLTRRSSARKPLKPLRTCHWPGYPSGADVRPRVRGQPQ